MTKICIYGAGAIGGYMAAALAEAGADVSLIARGPHLAAIQQKGLRLRKNGKENLAIEEVYDTHGAQSTQRQPQARPASLWLRAGCSVSRDMGSRLLPSPTASLEATPSSTRFTDLVIEKKLRPMALCAGL